MAIAAAAGLALAACTPPQPPTKVYAYPAWGFSEEFQSTPTVSETPAAPDGSRPHSFLVEADDAGRDFAVSVNDTGGVNHDIDSLTDAAAPLLAKRFGGEAANQTYAATAEGVLGRELLINRNGQPYMRVRFYLFGGRFYVLAAKSAFGVQDPAVENFMISFHVLNAKGQPSNAPG